MLGMRIYVDLDLLQLIQAPGVRQTVRELRFRRGDTAVIEVGFCQSGTVIELPSDATGRFGVKSDKQYEGDYLAAAVAWTKNGAGSSALYAFNVNFNTIEINAALKVNANPEDDVPQLRAMGEIEWIWGGNIQSTVAVTVLIDNDINKGTEGAPVSGNPVPMTWIDTPPATTTSPGKPGSAAFDGDFIYLCVATDTWHRVPVATWST